MVDISYDIKRKSILYNRKLYLDDFEIEEDKLIERLNEFSSDGKLNVYESAEDYSPKIILQEIEDLKES